MVVDYEMIKDYLRYIRQFKLHIAFLLAVLLSVFYCTNCRITKEPEKVWNLRGKLVTLAEHLQGIPYKFGGYDLEGFDCSGFVYYVYDSFGIRLPRTAKGQAKLKRGISLKRAKPGDVLAFKLKRQWHTAIYTEKNYFVHAPNQRGVVRKEYMNSYWKKHLKSVISIIKSH